jgi:DNA-binding response OmpR family regulator
MRGDYTVMTATNGLKGLDAYRTFNPDIIVTDMDMPEMNGAEMVRKIREEDDKTPIIMLTGLSESKITGIGFKSGVNNFLDKSTSVTELDFMIKGLLRIVISHNPEYMGGRHSDKINIGSYTFDHKNNSLTFEKETRSLTPFENSLLKILCDNRGNVVKRSDILKTIWSDEDIFKARSLDVFVRKLRDYLANDPSVKIVTVKGVGLKLEC